MLYEATEKWIKIYESYCVFMKFMYEWKKKFNHILNIYFFKDINIKKQSADINTLKIIAIYICAKKKVSTSTPCLCGAERVDKNERLYANVIN